MFRNPFRDISVGNIFVVIGAGLIVFQIGAKISTAIFKTQDIRLGWAFFLMIGFFAVIIPFVAFIKHSRLEREDYITIAIIEGILIFSMLVGKNVFPEIFASLPSSEGLVGEGFKQLQSVIGS